MGFRDALRGLFGGDAGGDDAPPAADLPEDWEIVGGDVVEAGGSGDRDEEGRDRPAVEEFPPGEAAEALAAQWAGYDLDFSPASLARLDEVIDAELEPAQYEAYGFRLGAYLGEVLVRSHDARWVRTEDAGWAVEVPDGSGDDAVVELAEPVQEALRGDGTLDAVYERLVPDPGPGEPSPGSDGTPDVSEEATDADPREEMADADPREEATAAEYYRERAERIAWTWPAYDLDFSVESLVRLDRLVAEEFEPGTGGPGDGFAGYLGEVFRRHHDAAWTRKDGEAVLVVRGESGAAELAPAELAAARREPEASFVDTYARVAADVGLRTLADE